MIVPLISISSVILVALRMLSMVVGFQSKHSGLARGVAGVRAFNQDSSTKIASCVLTLPSGEPFAGGCRTQCLLGTNPAKMYMNQIEFEHIPSVLKLYSRRLAVTCYQNSMQIARQLLL